MQKCLVQIKHDLPVVLSKGLCLSLLLVIILWMPSCKDKKQKTPEASGSAPTTTGYFKKLRLMKSQFDILAGYFISNNTNNQMVFQFYYSDTLGCGGSPTLYAYAMKPKHESIGKPPEILLYDSVTTEPLSGRSQVLGDLQVKIADLRQLLTQLSGGGSAEYYFRFTPKFRASNPHMYYNVTVVETTGGVDKLYDGMSVDCDPSPPYSAL